MVSITDFIQFMKNQKVSIQLYPLSFPKSNSQPCGIVEIGQGFTSRGAVGDVLLTVTVRDIHPQKAEQAAQSINSVLTDLTDEPLGAEHQIILVKSQQLIPYYMGQDDNKNHYYMCNFRVLVTK